MGATRGGSNTKSSLDFRHYGDMCPFSLAHGAELALRLFAPATCCIRVGERCFVAAGDAVSVGSVEGETDAEAARPLGRRPGRDTGGSGGALGGGEERHFALIVC